MNDTLREARQQVKPFAAQKQLRLQQVKPFAIAETGGEQRQITQLCPIEGYTAYGVDLGVPGEQGGVATDPSGGSSGGVLGLDPDVHWNCASL